MIRLVRQVSKPSSERSAVPVAGIPLYLAPQIPFSFGLQLIEWLEEQILTRGLRLVILDSYTALRGSRGSGVDIVKAEQQDLLVLDALAKRTRCAILIIHHSAKGAAGLDWSNQFVSRLPSGCSVRTGCSTETPPARKWSRGCSASASHG